MILFLLDFLVYNFTSYNTYFILLNLMEKKYYKKLFFIGVILDFIILKTYFKNLLVIFILIIINKYLLNFNKKNIVVFLAINIINYQLFIVLSSIMNCNLSFLEINNILVNNYLMHFIISVIYYYKFINDK